jgi:hypothetical protein
MFTSSLTCRSKRPLQGPDTPMGGIKLNRTLKRAQTKRDYFQKGTSWAGVVAESPACTQPPPAAFERGGDI